MQRTSCSLRHALLQRAAFISAPLLFLGLSACASLSAANFKPDAAQATAEIPAAPINPATNMADWAEAAPDRQPSTDWVSEFNDPVLSALVAEAMAANTNVRSAAARLRAAEASAASARSGLYPSVGISSRASRNETLDSRVPGVTGLSLGSNVSWEPDVWGRISDGANAGDLDAQASNADYAAARLSIAGLTAQTWFNLIEAEMQTDLAQRNVQTQDRALRLTKRRFDGGVSGSSDYRLARSALANAEATLALRRQNQNATARLLETLLRRYPEDALSAPEGLPSLPPLIGAGAPSEIFLRRPDLLAAERRLRSAGLRVDFAQKNLLPRLTLDGGVSTGGGSLTRLFSLEALGASLVGNLTAPVFQGGALKAEAARNEAVLDQQLESYADTVLTAYREVEDALDGEDLLRQREEALAISLEEARKAEERLELRFSEGLASILQLLDAQSRRISAEGQLISARKERLANRVRLHLALGGGVYGAEDARTPFERPKFPAPDFLGLNQ